jgi:hypothetical protein
MPSIKPTHANTVEINQMTLRENNAVELGMYAREMNDPRSANPYEAPEEQDLYDAWEGGWYEKDAELSANV